MLKRSLRNVFASALLLWGAYANAGIDVSGTVPMVWLSGNGDLWFTVNSPTTTTYCLPQWSGLTMYIPRSDPNFIYYYGLLATAVAKAKPVYVANISIYNGSTPCNISNTGYGIMLMQ
jgi:hypothetical protein